MSVENKEELMARIDASLNQVRPYLEADGGGISVVDITDEIITVVMAIQFFTAFVFNMVLLR